MSGRKGVDCEICEKHFRDTTDLKKHKARKTPCSLIIDEDDLSEVQKNNPNKCKFCNRVFTQASSVTRHIRKYCKIAPRNGDTSGMDKLFEHTAKKHQAQMDLYYATMMEMKTEINILRLAVESKELTVMPMASAPSIGENKLVQMGPGANAQIDQSSNKTMNIDKSRKIINTSININVFGSENTDHITKEQILNMLKDVGPLATDPRPQAERLLYQAAELIYSDEDHPENITCYIPNKTSKQMLIHSENKWRIVSASTELTKMAKRAVDFLFTNQPWREEDINENITAVMSFIGKNEKELINGACRPGSEFNTIPIRNKNFLQRMMKKLPVDGDS